MLAQISLFVPILKHREDTKQEWLPHPSESTLFCIQIGSLSVVFPNCFCSRPSWLESKEFKFVVGPERLEFMIHSELVAKQSEPLRALITNGMKESLEGVVKWSSVDVETFKRFSEYIHTGDFETQCCVSIEADPEASEARTTTLAEPFSASDGLIHSAWKRFQDNTTFKFAKSPAVYEADLWVIVDTDLSGVFSAIARVYMLAHIYDIGHLMDFCRAKIHSIMIRCVGGEVYDLLRICMTEPSAVGLRELVFEYCALNLDSISHIQDFRSVISEFPQAAVCIMKKIQEILEFEYKNEE